MLIYIMAQVKLSVDWAVNRIATPLISMQAPHNQVFFSTSRAVHLSFPMSGIEIAGLVLGAFPIALEILKQYEVVKTQVRLWRGIQEAYVECQDELIFQQLLFQDNLLDLFSMTMADDEKIKELISNPGGECWKDESLTGLLEQEHYELYCRCINVMNQIMEKLNHELRTGAKYVQQGLASSVRSSM